MYSGVDLQINNDRRLMAAFLSGRTPYLYGFLVTLPFNQLLGWYSSEQKKANKEREHHYMRQDSKFQDKCWRDVSENDFISEDIKEVFNTTDCGVRLVLTDSGEYEEII